ncbi:MAG: DUF86 domain-containing protein [Chitinophagales bacterium]|nr:DUF86 domain-containing protein [Chitinophagales bacterium]
MKRQLADIQKLTDILAFIEQIERYVATKSEHDFYNAGSIEKWGIVKLIENIGEAAGKLTDETKQSSTINWKVITGMRNRLVHEYDAINYKIVYEVATLEMKSLKAEVEKKLDELKEKFKDEL